MTNFFVTLLAIIFFMQSAAPISYVAPIDSEHSFVFIGGRTADYPSMGEYGSNLIYPNPQERLRLAISDRSGATWELGDPLVGVGESFIRVSRLDTHSVVLARTESDYGLARPSVKFFFDLAARKLLNVTQFDPSMKVTRLQVIDDRVCSSVRGGETAFVSCGDEREQTIVAQLGPSANLPEPTLHPLADSYRSPIPDALPRSTYDEFARARPERVRDGYGRESKIDERIGAHQTLGDRIWFGKAFYDGEGTTGVGGVGYYDVQKKMFTMLSIPEIADWSVSALMVEKDAVWVGLVRYPEGAERSGGLIRYDLSNGDVTRHDVPDVTLTIVRHSDAVFIGSSNGLYILRNELLTRFRFEPDRDGRVEPVRDRIP